MLLQYHNFANRKHKTSVSNFSFWRTLIVFAGNKTAVKGNASDDCATAGPRTHDGRELLYERTSSLHGQMERRRSEQNDSSGAGNARAFTWHCKCCYWSRTNSPTAAAAATTTTTTTTTATTAAATTAAPTATAVWCIVTPCKLPHAWTTASPFGVSVRPTASGDRRGMADSKSDIGNSLHMGDCK